ncbi:MAG: hypothetical protein IJ088_07890 [Clostridia bacterium]|nr:hypothetical protein [Clostridia bacterium]
MNKLPTAYGIDVYSLENLVGIAVNGPLGGDKDRALKAIVNEAIKYATEMETDRKPLRFLQQNIKDYNPDTMSEELKNYIWDALKYEMESAGMKKEPVTDSRGKQSLRD